MKMSPFEGRIDLRFLGSFRCRFDDHPTCKIKRVREFPAGLQCSFPFLDAIKLNLAISFSMKVISSAGSDAKVEYMRSLGADVPFNYKKHTYHDVLTKNGPIKYCWVSLPLQNFLTLTFIKNIRNPG
jgi:hypothetical protein